MKNYVCAKAEFILSELQSAVSAQNVSFEQLMAAIYLYHTEQSGASGHPLDELLSKIREVFTQKHGQIEGFYFCKERKAAAILTAKQIEVKPTWSEALVTAITRKPLQSQRSQLNFFTDYTLGEDPALECLLIECEQLAVETKRLLDGSDSEACLRMLYTITKHLLCLIDHKTQTPLAQTNQADQPAAAKLSEEPGANSVAMKTKKIDEMTELVSKQIQIAKNYHQRAIRLKAQHHYFQGMLLGLGVVGMVGILSILITKPGFTHPMFLSLLICGGIGAVISIMSRMSSGNLRLDYAAGKAILRQIGIFRTVMGAIFAVVIYAVLQSTLLPIKMPSTDAVPVNLTAQGRGAQPGANQSQASELPNNPTLFLYYVVAFLAGFSERLVPDILHVTGQRITVPSEQPET